jgi:hypothetical protein
MTFNPGRFDDRVNLAIRKAVRLDAGQDESDQCVADHVIPMWVLIDLRQGGLPGVA